MPAAGRRSPGYSQLLCAVATDRRFPRAPPQVQIICYGGSQNSGKRLVKVPRLLRVMVKDPDEQLGEAVHGAGAGAGRPRVRELLSHGIGAPRPPGAPVSSTPPPEALLALDVQDVSSHGHNPSLTPFSALLPSQGIREP